VQDAFQVVGVLALAGAAYRAGREQLLDPAEDFAGGERLVQAGVLDATPAGDADIDRVGEDLGEALPGDRLDRAVPPPPAGEATMAQLARQTLEAPLAAGVVFEGHGDEWGASGVGDDAGHLAAGDEVLDVQIADRRAVGEAPELGVLHHALLDLGGQVG